MAVIAQTHLSRMRHAIGAAPLLRQRLRDHLQYRNPERILGGLRYCCVKCQIRAVRDSIGLQRASVFVHSLPHGHQIVVRGFYGRQDANPTSMMDQNSMSTSVCWRYARVENHFPWNNAPGVGIRTIAPTWDER